MNMLARREQSFFELTQKITQRYPDLDPVAVILPALEKLRQENLQSDARFVESYIRYRSSRGQGPLKISMELQQKGIAREVTDTALYNGEYDWAALCKSVMLKRFSTVVDMDTKARQQIYRFLLQRGFAMSEISKHVRLLDK